MNLFFRKEVMGDVTRLVLDIQEDVELDLFDLNMISRNRIESLIPIQLSQFNNEHYLQYDISNKNTLATKLANVLKKTEVEQLLNSIMHAFEEVEAYMLSESCLYLDWNYIFLDEESNKCFFVYLPFETEVATDKIMFLRTVVEQIQEDYTERENYIYDIRNAFSRGAVKKIGDLKDLLKKNYKAIIPAAQEEHRLEASAPSYALPKEEEQVNAIERTNTKSGSKGVKGFSLNIPGKEKNSPNTSEKEKQVVNIPGKESISMKIPGKENAVLNIPGKESSPINIPGKSEPVGKHPAKSGMPFNIPGKTKAFEEKQAEKESKKKKDMKMPELNLFGKKASKEEMPQIDFGIQQREVEQIRREQKNNEMYESYEHTVLMAVPQDSQETVLAFSQEVNANNMFAKLLRKKTSEMIEVNKSNWTIGAGQAVDYCVLGNKTISRNHATIQIQNGRFFFVDNKSSNGSWVDGRRLEPGEYVELNNNCMIRLSDEDFIFQIL